MAFKIAPSSFCMLPLAMFIFIFAMQSAHKWRCVMASPIITEMVYTASF